MVSFISIASIAVLVFLPMVALGDDSLSPALSPFYDKVCDEVECGKGTCKANIKYPFNYVCECEPGWKRTKDEDVNDDLKFLPCVIPNCTLNYSCQPAPPPVSKKEVPHNSSAFDPCYWMYCGEGTCKQTTTYKHECECKAGYSNLLNKTFFPCYSDCTLGSDCASLGITEANTQASTTSDAGKGPVATFLPDKFQWFAVLIMSIAMAMWK